MSVVFRADSLPPASRVDFWRETISNVFMPLDLKGELGPKTRVELRTAEMGPIRLTDSVTGAGALLRTGRTRRHIRSSDPDIYLVGVVVEGDVRVEQDGRQAILSPGDLSFIDPSRPFQQSFTAMRNIRVCVPNTLIPLRASELRELTGVRIPGDQGAGAPASALVRQLARGAGDLSAAEAARLGTAVADVLSVALAGHLGRTSAVSGARERTLLHSIYAFVEEELGHPELTPHVIAAAHHISLRQLYKLFESEPMTLGDWIRRRRLERCRQDLADPALRDRPVAAIAARWGFPSPSHFTRTFRRAYGLSPADFRSRTPASAKE